ncbi:hypothetical protein, partial [Bacteroides acidifaciens]|uniref:hypothetical protein n=1 Tax=Bacteroides acidifaciens TaxID=85831 RepID=UPI0024314620
LRIFHINHIFHKATKNIRSKSSRREIFSRLLLFDFICFFTVLPAPPLFSSCTPDTATSIYPNTPRFPPH